MKETKIRMKFNRSLVTGEAILLRGAVASENPELGLLHNHNGAGYRYSSPLIQYKIVEGDAVVVGLEAGSEILKEIAFGRESYRFGKEVLHLLRRVVSIREVEFGTSEQILKYIFITPWVALNENNFRLYVKSNTKGKRTMLKKILIGNIIALSKGLEYTVNKRLVVKDLKLRQVTTKLKSVSMVGFYGLFAVNFVIPELWGIGKSASRGFGTVRML